jgi:hypothetical protein
MINSLRIICVLLGLLVPSLLRSQESVSSCFVPAALVHSSIVVGRIDEVRTVAEPKRTTVLIGVEQYLAEDGESSRTMEVLVDWDPSAPTAIRAAGKPAWQNIVPAVGKRLLLSVSPWLGYLSSTMCC